MNKEEGKLLNEVHDPRGNDLYLLCLSVVGVGQFYTYIGTFE